MNNRAAMYLPAAVEITEVGPRDGFQNIREWIPTATKLEIIEGLIGCGFRTLEVTAFVHPKAVPQMADATELLTTLKRCNTGVAFIALTPNLKGVANALEAGADELTYIVSASERHNFENTRQSIDQSLEGLGEVCRIKGKAKLRLAIPTAFICPWTGKVPPENVLRIIDYGLAAGIDEFGLGDTIGAADPRQVRELLALLESRRPDAKLTLHLHDTRGMGLANVLSALQAGVTRFETSFGGLGGCPFAPGAAGNIASEDLINMLDGLGVASGIDLERLLTTVRRAQKVLPVPLASHLLSAMTSEIPNGSTTP